MAEETFRRKFSRKDAIKKKRFKKAHHGKRPISRDVFRSRHR